MRSRTVEGNRSAAAQADGAALNPDALDAGQRDLVSRLHAYLDRVGPTPTHETACALPAGFWPEVLEHPEPRLVFGAEALRAYPRGGTDRGVSLVVDRSEEALAVALRDAALRGDLEAGRLLLASPQSELDLIEEAKRLLTSMSESSTVFLAFVPGLVAEEAETYRRWGESVLRFLEVSRDLTVLNLEMYARFKLVADRIDAMGSEPCRILDVGGREWLFSAFLPRHRITVADVETTGLDGRALPFPARSFDIVTGHHVLEHVSESDRSTVLAEMVRVARKRVFLTGPFSDSPCAAELDRFLSRLAPDNPYLQEHLRLGLPSLGKVDAWLHARSLSYRVEPITPCNTWLLAMALSAMQQVRPDACREVNRYYNRRFQELDRVEPAYQSLIEIRIG